MSRYVKRFLIYLGTMGVAIVGIMLVIQIITTKNSLMAIVLAFLCGLFLPSAVVTVEKILHPDGTNGI